MRAVKRIVFILGLFAILFSFSACGKNAKAEPARIDISKIASWSFDKDGDFKTLEKWGRRNLYEIAGSNGSRLWLKFDFTIPDELKNKNLAIIIPYVHFAEKSWFNGVFLGSDGVLPEDGPELSSRYSVHHYELPLELLNQEGNNTFLMKVYCKGLAEISGESYIAETGYVNKKYGMLAFLHTRMFLIVVGGPFATFILFLTLFLTRKKKVYVNLYFALMNLATDIFMGTFVASEVPWYASSGLSYLFFIKIAICLSLTFMIYYMSNFEIAFLYTDVPKSIKKQQLAILAVSVVAILVAPTLDILMRMTIPLGILLFIQWGYGTYFTLKAYRNPKKRKQTKNIISGFIFLYICFVADIIFHLILNNTELPINTISGYQVMLITFVVLLSRDVNKAIDDNEYLNANLEKEIQLQTVDVTFAYERLEQEVAHSQKDLEMAGIVQSKFMPSKNPDFENWDVAVAYEPLSKVSGDLYDYFSYEDDNVLNGLAVFDASGHGISASLITMLSKRIIFQAFKKTCFNGMPASAALLEINEKFIKAKGGVDNYLTGVILKLSNEQEKSLVNLASAGHPYPVWYSGKSGGIEELLPDVNNVQYGAIGIPDIEVSFPDIDFEMMSGDVLVIFTDGVLEGLNEDREQFGRKRLEQIICENHELSAEEIKLKILNNYNGFLGENLRDDDVTFVVLKRK